MRRALEAKAKAGHRVEPEEVFDLILLETGDRAAAEKASEMQMSRLQDQESAP